MLLLQGGRFYTNDDITRIINRSFKRKNKVFDTCIFSEIGSNFDLTIVLTVAKQRKIYSEHKLSD